MAKSVFFLVKEQYPANHIKKAEYIVKKHKLKNVKCVILNGKKLTDFIETSCAFLNLEPEPPYQTTYKYSGIKDLEKGLQEYSKNYNEWFDKNEKTLTKKYKNNVLVYEEFDGSITKEAIDDFLNEKIFIKYDLN